MQRIDIILPSLLTAFGAVILWQSVTKMDYFYADRGAPGPGLLPFWVALGVIILGGIVTVRAIRSPEHDAADLDWPDALGKRRILYLLGGFILLLAAIPLIGFVLASILFLIGVSFLLGMRSLPVLIPTAILVGLFIHLVFDAWLRLSLPKGYLGDLIGGNLPWIF